MSFDISKLTLGEYAQVEDLSGLPISAMADETKPKVKQQIALAYVIKKRSDPTFTYSQAEALTMNDLQELLGSGEDDDPKVPNS